MIIGNPVLTGGGGITCVLTITTEPGANITAVLENRNLTTVADSSGTAVLKLRKEGVWTVTATNGTYTKTISVEVTNKRNENLLLFPSEPSSYALIDTYTTDQTWTAPEDGYYEIELQGASGNGGKGATSMHTATYQTSDTSDDDYWIAAVSGGSGGGGGCAISRVKLYAGDNVILSPGAVGEDSTVTINSSLEEYTMMKVTAATDGGKATSSSGSGDGGTAGEGGVGSGGNYANYTGGVGNAGDESTNVFNKEKVDAGNLYMSVESTKPAGGKAGYTGGNAGGKGGSVINSSSGPTYTDPGSGKAGFVKIYRGDTNNVA